MSLSKLATREERLTFIEKETDCKFSAIDKSFVDTEVTTHCENLIGSVSLPLGIAGKLSIKDDKNYKKELYLPLATTEGALVASVNRGCKVSRESGGFFANVSKVGTTRGPVFYTGTVEKGKKLAAFIKKNFIKLKKEAESSSGHLKVIDFVPKINGPYLFLRCIYDTSDAMGMNMVTIASQKVSLYIEENTEANCLAVAGNYDLDKKPNWLNFINGRGFEGWAEVTVSEKVIKSVLKSTAKKIFDVWLGKCMVGSGMSGSLGFNSHFANIVAAFYAATGQDLAHTVEGSTGMTICRLTEKNDLYVSVYMPSIMIGTVGGGTKLKTQTEAINMTRAENSEELAKILVAAVLAGEISLLASLAEQSLAKAHKSLGR
jgi:hydroxymethylglutaryl-CoA reductase (NADPH)